MKQVLSVFFTIFQLSCLAQFDKPLSVRATANFNGVREGLATNDAGFGLGLDVSFFSTHRLQALIETSADWFVGDKLLVINATTGESSKPAAVHSIKFGPQFFVHKSLALSVTYGPAWSVLQDWQYSRNNGIKYSVTGFVGRERKTIAKLFMVNLPTPQNRIQYFGFAAGIRF
ncbi:MAG: hypothetical protein WKF70_04765 [Chitinophagaceae bacterium]